MLRDTCAVAAALALQIALAVAAGPAQAASVGLYGSAGVGTAGWDDEGNWGGDGADRESRHAGAGFALETPLGIFPLGYRLGIGWERIDREGGYGGPDVDLEGLVIDQDLTWDLVASPAARFWVGPELRLGYLHGSIGNDYRGERTHFAAGIGPVLGFDVALNPGMALSWKLGYLFTEYYADEDSGNDYDRYREDYRHDDDDPTGVGRHAYVSLTVLFRLGVSPHAGPPPAHQPQGRW